MFDIAQAFSHFTYEASHGRLILIDIQGWDMGGKVMFTDPQVHTDDNPPKRFSVRRIAETQRARRRLAAGAGAGENARAFAEEVAAARAQRADGQSREAEKALCQAMWNRFSLGNLYRVGMADFFSTHRCNRYCELLKLSYRVEAGGSGKKLPVMVFHEGEDEESDGELECLPVVGEAVAVGGGGGGREKSALTIGALTGASDALPGASGEGGAPGTPGSGGDK